MNKFTPKIVLIEIARQWKYLSLILILFIFLWTITPSSNQIKCELFNEFLTKEITGVVDRAFIDSKNHYRKLVAYKENGQFFHIDLSPDINDSHKHLKSGMIIIKEPGSADLHIIYHEIDTVLVVDFSCSANN